MHRLLARQLKRHLQYPPGITKEVAEFLQAIDEAYEQADVDRTLLERSLELVSRELMQKHDALKQETQRLEAKMKQLELLNAAMMGREERILELKQELRMLRGQQRP